MSGRRLSGYGVLCVYTVSYIHNLLKYIKPKCVRMVTVSCCNTPVKYSNMQQYAATCSNMRQHAATYSNMRQHAATYSNMRQHAATCSNMRQHAATCSNMRQHAATCGNMRSIRKNSPHSTTDRYVLNA